MVDEPDNQINIDVTHSSTKNSGIQVGGSGATTGVDLSNVKIDNSSNRRDDDNLKWYAMVMVFILLIIALAWGRNRFAVKGLGVEGQTSPPTINSENISTP